MNNMVPRPDENPFRRYARQVAARRLDGRRLHLSRDGQWLAGESERIAPNTLLAAMMGDFLIGWEKWVGQQRVSEAVGLVPRHSGYDSLSEGSG